jgi:hypothetical protein
MNLEEERQKILDLFEKYPNRMGSRTDLSDGQGPYKRWKLISEELGGRWSTSGHLPLIQEMLENDTETLFFTKGLVKHNWSVVSAYRIFKERLYQYDKENSNVIVGKIDNDEKSISTLELLSSIEKHYKISKGNFLYYLEIKDGNEIFPYKKIGITSNLDARISSFNTGVPFEIYPIGLWNVEYGKSNELEAYIHRQLKDVHKKGEWFIDVDNNLIKRLRSIIKEVEHIRVMEVFNDDRLKNVDKFSKIMKFIHEEVGVDGDIKISDNLIEVKVNETEGFGFFGGM